MRRQSRWTPRTPLQVRPAEHSAWAGRACVQCWHPRCCPAQDVKSSAPPCWQQIRICLLTLWPSTLVPFGLVIMHCYGLSMLSFHVLLLPRPHPSLLVCPRNPLHCRGRSGEVAAAGEDHAVSH